MAASTANSITDLLYGPGSDLPQQQAGGQGAQDGQSDQASPYDGLMAGLVDPTLLPQRPVWGKRGAMGDILDNLLLGGAIQKARTSEYNQKALDFQNAQQQLQQMASYAHLMQMSPDERNAWLADAKEAGKAYATNFSWHDVAPGATAVPGGDPRRAFMAPQLDTGSGKYTWLDPTTHQLVTSDSAGGDFTDMGGAVVSKRNAANPLSISQPQQVSPGNAPATFTPTITPNNPAAPGGNLPQGPTLVDPNSRAALAADLGGVGALSGRTVIAPPAGALPLRGQRTPGTAPALPSQADVVAAAPGAKITSGYRTPEHNAEVGGVPASWHTVGTPGQPGAFDVTPAPGQSMDDLAAHLTTGLPGFRILNEGNHVHVQPAARNSGAGAAPAAPASTAAAPAAPAPGGGPKGWAVSSAAPVWSEPYFNPQANRQEQRNNYTHEVKDAGESGYKAQSAKQDFVGSEIYKNYANANDAFGAMVRAAGLPQGGARAYALRDTFARVINPGAVARVGTIDAIKQSQGVPENIRAYLLNLKGDGDVPPEVAQQILDVSRGFLASHYASAKALNDANGAQATRFNQRAEDAMAPMGAMPGNIHIRVPAKNMLTRGDIYRTGKGLGVWNGERFDPYGG